MTETWRSPELHPKPNNTNIIKGSAVKFSLLCRHAAEANINRLCFIHFRVSFMNNQKQQKPTLTGQRFKTRKRGLCERFSALHAFCCSYQTRVLIHDMCAFSFLPPQQMKRRDLTLLSFKKVSYKAWIKLALIWKRSRSSLMPLAPSLTTAGMQRHSLTSWWPAACWVSCVEAHIKCLTFTLFPGVCKCGKDQKITWKSRSNTRVQTC